MPLRVSVTAKRILFCCLLLPASLFLKAQNTKSRVLTGNVTDKQSGDAIQGVFIKVLRNNNSALSKADGSYRITIRNTDTLVFTHVGYKTLQLIPGEREKADLQLEAQEKEMDEVVIIGYGQVRKTDLTGSAATLNTDDLKKAPVPSFDQALAGRIAGVQVSANEGQPGTEMNIVIRGGNSLTQSNTPLYVIDGFPVENPSLAALNPDDIASMTILKDASATAIYGSRGANGVIVIETKRGKAGRTQIRYDGSAGIQQVFKRMDLMDPYEFVKYQVELQPISGADLYLNGPGLTTEDYKNFKGYDWQDRLFRTGKQTSHTLSLTGGNSNTRFAFSGSYFDQEGVIIHSGYKRYQGRLSVDHTASRKLKIGINANYTSDQNYGQLASAQQNTNLGYSTYTLYQTWGYRPVSAPNEGIDLGDDFLDEEANDLRVNPVISVENEIRRQYRNTLLANAYATYNLAPGLDFTLRAGVSRRYIKDAAFYNSRTGRGFPGPNNTKGVNGSIYEREINDWLNENTLNYRKRFKNKNSLDAVAGFTIQGRDDIQSGFEAQQVPNEQLGLSGLDEGIPTDVLSLTSKNTLVSFLGRVNYNLKSRYLFTASFRADGSSKFAPGNQWGYFPSGAFAWRFSEEKFMKKLSFVTDAKFRVSYGLTGNNRVADYVRFSSIDLPYGSYYSFDNQVPSPSAIPNRFGNADLRWETTGQLDMGLDIGFLNNRIRFIADVYRKTTYDLLLNANVPNSTGFSKIYKNVGRIRNQGLELTLNTVNVQSKRFTWSSDFNISFNNNRVMELSEGEEALQSSVSWTGDYNATFLYLTKLNGPAAAFYGLIWDGNYQYADFDEVAPGQYVLKSTVASNGTARDLIQPGDIKYRDINGDGIVNDMDYVIIGRALPIHTGGFNNNFTYGNFSLNIFFQWSYGNSIFNANRLMLEGNALRRNNLNQFASYVNRWTPENQSNTYYRTGGEGPRGIYSSRTIEDGSYLRLKTVSLAYIFPATVVKKIGIQNLQLYGAAQNLVTWTNYSGMDPEVSVRNTALTPGFDYSAYPNARTITIGLKAGF